MTKKEQLRRRIKKSAFDELFQEVIEFNIGTRTLGISRIAYTKEEAFQKFYEYIEDWDKFEMKSFKLEDVKEEQVVWKGGRDEDGEFTNAWWLYAEGKRSKPVWIYNMYQLDKFK